MDDTLLPTEEENLVEDGADTVTLIIDEEAIPDEIPELVRLFPPVEGTFELRDELARLVD